MAVISTLLLWLTLVGDIIIALWIADRLLVVGSLKARVWRGWHRFGKHALWLGFVVSLVATLGSLYYSDVLGYEPCKLCWYQRIFMYPQPFLFGLALWRGEPTRIWPYSAFLSLVGGAIALFHYYIQTSPNPLVTLPCSALGYSASCTETFAVQLGYITIPMMALTAFALVLIAGRLAVHERS